MQIASEDNIWVTVSTAKTPKECNFTKFQCQTQSVEHCVTFVIVASSKRVGAKKRHGFIRTTLLSRASTPTCKSKRNL